ncbi:UPF0489 family protein [Salimicrobium salexigens]|uniref:UPF0489 domain-containing protein n=1 Tax=Salimicrobium salexigens TaxID=908941 RepID=A0ABY1KUH3_9BACI|nr:UPF0489 family protein [Salimicrobium salexigens]SIS66660.1 UPF0489 domain-containing protein [Salimicrobium salexigens]
MKKVQDMEHNWKIKYPRRNVYLMRNHNWAFSAWEIGRINKEIKPGAKLLHVDFHDDYSEPSQRLNEIETKEEAIRIAETLTITEFIKAAEKTGTIKEVFSIGDYEKPSDEICHSYTYNQFEYEYRKEFFRTEGQSFILDLDLDFFNLHAHRFIDNNHDNNPYRFSDEFIRKQLEFLKNYEDEWSLVSVCISPEHCGGSENAQQILEIFLDTFDLNNEDYIYW